MLLLQYRNLKLTDQQFILLIYLLSVENHSFNPKQIQTDLGLSLEQVMNEFYLFNLTDIVRNATSSIHPQHHPKQPSIKIRLTSYPG